MQTAQLDRMQQMFQAYLNNTQMARRTGAACQTEAPSLNVWEMREQIWRAPSPRRGAGGPQTEAPLVNCMQARDQNRRGVLFPRRCGRWSRMEDVN